jgi:23S rRNA pseudouridine1911/1915/1917 synthase
MKTKMERGKLKIPPESRGMRTDRFLAGKLSEYSRAYLQKLIKNGNVLADGKAVTSPKAPLRATEITIDFPEEKTMKLMGENIPLEILFEDDGIMVINKPPGMVVHPAAGNWSGTLVNALIGRDDEFLEEMTGDGLRPGIVHRLDKDTSGCLVAAKNPRSKYRLSAMFQARKIEKIYAALTYGCPPLEQGRVETLIGRHPVKRKKMAVVERNGRNAVTLYRVLKRGHLRGFPVAFTEVRILTGRTHQIRVHMAYKKAPVLGDAIYGGRQKISAPRQMLHAWKLKFKHPLTGHPLSFESPFPEDFSGLLSEMK